MSPSMVVALNDSETEIGSRVTTSPVSVCTSMRRAAPLRTISPSVGTRDQLVEIGVGKHHTDLLLGGDGQPAGQIRRQHERQLAGPAPIQEWSTPRR